MHATVKSGKLFLCFRFKAHLESNSPVDVIPAKDYGRLVKEIDSLPPGMTVDDDTETSSMNIFKLLHLLHPRDGYTELFFLSYQVNIERMTQLMSLMSTQLMT